MRLILASGNRDKLREFREIFGGARSRVIPMGELGLSAEAEENGLSFSENADIKAREIYEKRKAQAAAAGETRADEIILSDDSGLMVDALDGAPGIYSARWMGHDTPYAEKNRILIEKLSGLKGSERGAQFVCDLCAILPDGEALHAEGVMRGEIALSAEGSHGFGYDPIFYLPERGCTSAALSPEDKNAISHRGLALRSMLGLLRERYPGEF